MIQDIAPDWLDNAFVNCAPEEDEPVLVFDESGRLYARTEEGTIRFTCRGQAEARETVYLFSLSGQRFFLMLEGSCGEIPGYGYLTVRELRDRSRGKELFAAFTAYHLWRWYADNRRCGRCGEKTAPDARERALRCTKCGHVIYPRINPAVIVGVTRGDEILITRYRTGYAHNALVAGFAEIGETLEQTVAREVMEETGIKVKNIRYYKSQPWGMAQDMLAGFYCEADGDGEIRMDENELKYAEWVRREDVVLQPNDLSLTNEMMKKFRDNEE